MSERVSADDIARAKAVDFYALIAAEVDLKREGANWSGLCPFHGERTPSFKVFRGQGNVTWHAHCFGCGEHVRDPIAWVMRRQNLAFPEAVRYLVSGSILSASENGRRRSLAQRPPEPPQRMPPPEDDAKRTEAALKLWREAERLRDGTPASLYLKSRAIWSRHAPESLRYASRCWCDERADHLPAIIAAIVNWNGQLTAVQRIYLEEKLVTDSGTGPAHNGAKLKARKKTLGPMGDGAVRLAEAGETLILAEGVETSLACIKLFRFPAWATCGMARLSRVWVPEEATRILIAADPGEAALAAAESAAEHFRRQGRIAEVIPPPAAGDWANELLRRTV